VPFVRTLRSRKKGPKRVRSSATWKSAQARSAASRRLRAHSSRYKAISAMTSISYDSYDSKMALASCGSLAERGQGRVHRYIRTHRAVCSDNRAIFRLYFRYARRDYYKGHDPDCARGIRHPDANELPTSVASVRRVGRASPSLFPPLSLSLSLSLSRASGKPRDNSSVFLLPPHRRPRRRAARRRVV